MMTRVKPRFRRTYRGICDLPFDLRGSSNGNVMLLPAPSNRLAGFASATLWFLAVAVVLILRLVLPSGLRVPHGQFTLHMMRRLFCAGSLVAMALLSFTLFYSVCRFSGMHAW